MASRLWWLGLVAAVSLGSASAQTGKDPRAPDTRITEPPVWSRLERFASEEEFRRYVRDTRQFAGRRRAEGVVTMDSVAAPPPPPPPPSAAPMAGAAESRSASQPAVPDGSSITNVQTQGVDEGGIVKQVGRFLVTLQDGRLFVTDMRPNGEAGLRLVTRMNVYRNAAYNTWYDEMLTSGNRILVTGYSYRDAASEVNIFTIDDNGQLARETTYYISSNDYYDTENYATRLVNGNLVIYTPLWVSMIDPDRPVQWPLVRRWLRDGERQSVTTRGRPLFDAEDIYKPIQRTQNPVIHSVSVCPLGGPRAGDELECRTTAFVGMSRREFFVSTSDIYLWVTPGYGDDAESNCRGTVNTTTGPYAAPATIFQVPLSGASPRALHARGQPADQLSLDASTDEFRALVQWNTGNCLRRGNAELRYFHAPLDLFSTTPRQAPWRSFVAAPSPNTSTYETRFTPTHVVYGAREGYSSYPPEGRTLSARVVALPTARPTQATVIEAPHNVLRVERAGDGMAITGYRTDAGLSVSMLTLGARPRIADTTFLENRYEAENRSHAFNALVGADGNGLMGLPTVTRVKEGGRWFFRSQASDLSFLSVDPSNQLRSLGALTANTNAQHPSYRCEVSCVDWYGNSRALFTGGRVFALSGTELIEGTLTNEGIGELRRINLSAPPPR